MKTPTPRELPKRTTLTESAPSLLLNCLVASYAAAAADEAAMTTAEVAQLAAVTAETAAVTGDDDR
ncbi:hypothetical protein E2562_033954 [Oryza meyeriana var. granulata]|uniref:Uncharacterized protein n=1 Tax=Oryza meyeriana var. granulata TaxID=110450 RepID=A0A6G1C273_9ORYZ|nr:hypothetical protein E2562_033954 [Oryza meyeriana var. granulata]